jgi:DtxR family Mn-dependent transcriptional regulator
MTAAAATPTPNTITHDAAARVLKLTPGELTKLVTDGHITLTDSGEELAQRVVRRHRIAERFMTDILGLSWALAHREAGRWEHVMSDAVEEAMRQKLGNPTTCPHGNPIPGSGYAAPPAVSLSKLNTGQSFTVSRIPEELEFSPGMLEFLENTNLMPGMSGQVSATDDKGDMTLSVEGHDIVGLER